MTLGRDNMYIQTNRSSKQLQKTLHTPPLKPPMLWDDHLETIFSFFKMSPSTFIQKGSNFTRPVSPSGADVCSLSCNYNSSSGSIAVNSEYLTRSEILPPSKCSFAPETTQ